MVRDVLKLTGACLLLAMAGNAASEELPLSLTSPQVVALLKAGSYQELDQHYEALQRAYEADEISEITLAGNFRTFCIASKARAHQLDAWAAHSPDSYAAHLARGIYYECLGVARRGTESASATDAQKFRAMNKAFAVAVTELDTSLPLAQKPILTYARWIEIDRYAGKRGDADAKLERALENDPRTLVVREQYMFSLSTQWGGDQEAMERFLDRSRGEGLSESQLKRLQSYIVSDRAWIEMYQNNDPLAAARHYMEAYELSGDSGCLRCAADAFFAAQDFSGAIDAYSKLLAINPRDSDALHRRGWAYIWHSSAPQRGVADFKRAASFGDGQAKVDLARLYLTAKFVSYDRARAIALLKSAVAAGFEPATSLLAMVNSGAFQDPGTKPVAQ